MSEAYFESPALTTYVYALLCPDTLAVRYVGKTTNDPRKRLAHHLCDPATNHRTYWLRSLRREGKRPVLAVLEVIAGSGWQEERDWIADFRATGEPLVNQTDGGEGVPGRVMSAEQKAKIGDANRGRGRKRVDVACAHCGATLSYHPFRLKQSKSGLFFCSKSHKSLYLPPEQREKRAEAMRRRQGPRERLIIDTSCGVCGVAIQRYRRQLDAAKDGVCFCSSRCSAYHHARLYDPPRKGKKASEATLKRLSDSHKRWHEANPKYSNEEKSAAVAAVAAAGGNVQGTAKRLGIPCPTLRGWVRKCIAVNFEAEEEEPP